MRIKAFGDKKIVVRKISNMDDKIIKEFLIFVNSLVEEDAKILINKK